MIRVKFLKSHPAFGYFPGDMGIVTPENAQKLLPGGYILPLPDEDMEPQIPQTTGPAGDVNTLPADLPEREKLFTAGYSNIAQVKEAGEKLLDIPGISQTKLKKINKHLENFVFGE